MKSPRSLIKLDRPKLLALIALLLAIAAFFSLKQAAVAAATNSARGLPGLVPGQERLHFQTPWQEESRFIVESIVADLAEMAAFAKSQELLESNQVSVKTTAKTNSPSGALVYEVEITTAKSKPPIKVNLSIDRAIWSPEVYAGISKALFESASLSPSPSNQSSAGGNHLVAGLAELTARKIQQENLTLSTALGHHLQDAELHEEAAFLLGAFMLRDSSRDFFDIRAPLCRMTAHLAFARAAGGQTGSSQTREVAETLLLTLINSESEALQKIARWESAGPEFQPWARALRTRNTHDYRILAGVKELTVLEKLELFRARCYSGDADAAWQKLEGQEKLTGTDYLRIAQAYPFSVETGHEAQPASIPLELQELREVYSLANGTELARDKAAESLNVVPERAVGSALRPQVQIIGWGQWANFEQRHLCHCLQQNFRFLADLWGVPERAKDFSEKVEAEFSGLRLYPFVRRFNSRQTADYRRAIEDGFAATAKTPHLIPVQAWNSLYWPVKFAPLYYANPGPQIEAWLKENFPHGTTYDSIARLNNVRMQQYADMAARAERWHQLSPYDGAIAQKFLIYKYYGRATVAQSEEILGPILEFNAEQNYRLAERATEQPEHYEKLMLRAARINPENYFHLGKYFAARHEDEKAAGYYEKGMQLGSDSVRAANNSGWLVKYYQDKGMTNKALTLAEGAADVYSSSGLQTKADLMESLGRYDEALEIYHNIEERYGPYPELTGFLTRYKAKTGDKAHDAELDARLKKIFPNGVERVALKDFPPGQPKDGVLIRQQSELTRQAGLDLGTIIVAVFGIRAHTFEQYTYARETSRAAEMNLIIWKRGQYSEITVNLPNRRFGVQMTSFPTASNTR